MTVSEILSRGGPLCLDLGCGQWRKSGHVGVDIRADLAAKYADGLYLLHDLSKGIPFPDESADAILSSHCLEHFSFDDGERLLGECWRVLKRAAPLELWVPYGPLYALDPAHKSWYTEDWFEKNLPRLGFKITKEHYVYTPSIQNRKHIFYALWLQDARAARLHLNNVVEQMQVCSVKVDKPTDAKGDT